MSRSLPACLVFAALLTVLNFSASAAEDRKAKVLTDRAEVEAAGHWIYNDLSAGFAEAQKTGKPMLVVFRCLP